MLTTRGEKQAKPSSLLASKIKTKMLNTSSFFKVSLKTNNKALALALVAEKEKSRRLETETVRLRREVGSLSFTLAVHRHRRSQLVAILKELHSNALHRLTAAVDILTCKHDEGGDEQLLEDYGKMDINLAGNCFVPSCNPTRPLTSPLRKEGATITATKTEAKAAEGTTSQPQPEAPKSLSHAVEGISQARKRLQLEMDKLSTFYSQNSPQEATDKDDGKLQYGHKALNQSGRQPGDLLTESTAETHEESANQEKTTFVETEMEITVSECVAEIEAVETRPQKRRKEGGDKSRRNEKGPSDKDCCSMKDKKMSKSSAGKNEDVILKHQNNLESEKQQRPSCAMDSAIYRNDNEKFNELNQDTDKSVSPRRKTYVTSRSSKSRMSTFSVINKSRLPIVNTYVKSDLNTASLDLLVSNPISQSTQDDIFTDTDVSLHSCVDKEIPWNLNVYEGDVSQVDSRETNSYSTVKKKPYTVSASNCPSAKSRNKVEPTRSKAEPAPVRERESAECLSDFQGGIRTFHQGHYVADVHQKRGPTKEPMEMDIGTRKECFPERSLSSSKRKRASSSKSQVLMSQESMITENIEPEALGILGFGTTHHVKSTKECLDEPKKKKKKRVADMSKDAALSGKEKMKISKCREALSSIEQLGGMSKTRSSAELPQEQQGERSYKNLEKGVDCRRTYMVSLKSTNLCDSSMSVPEDSTERPIVPTTQGCLVVNRKTYNVSQAQAFLKTQPAASKGVDLDCRTSPSNIDLIAEETNDKGRRMIVEERPPWESFNASSEWPSFMESQPPSPAPSHFCSQMGIRVPDRVVDEIPLRNWTNTNVEDSGRTRRRGGAIVSYKEPSINCKMRRGDKFTDTKFLRSPIFKDKKKRRCQKSGAGSSVTAGHWGSMMDLMM